MTAFYNEIDAYAAAWLRNLIAAGLIAPGVVDERSIEDINPEELNAYTQCHFFAGIGVWSLALRRAGWPDDRPVWTGSCPCQPFSAAGKGGGFDDERHLWPAFHHLIRSCQPPAVFGEQVASRDGRTWLGLVHADLEGVGYSVGAADLCAAGVGAPHIRQRLYWVADTADGGRNRRRSCLAGHGGPKARVRTGIQCSAIERGGEIGYLAQPSGGGLEGRSHRDGLHQEEMRERAGQPSENGGDPRPMANAIDGTRFGSLPRSAIGLNAQAVGGHWSACDWIPCRDGKWRPVEPGTFPLAHRAPSRVGRLRAYGNAIVEPCAEAFIRAYLGSIQLREMFS